MDNAVAGHSEHAASHADIEAQVTRPNVLEHRATDVLQMDVDDPIPEALDQAGIIKAAGDSMSSVEKQAGFLPPVLPKMSEISSNVSATIIR